MKRLLAALAISLVGAACLPTQEGAQTLLDGVGEGADDVLLADDLAEALGAVTAVEGG